MKLLNIIFLSIFSLNAFGAALTEEPISPGTIAPAASSSIDAQTHNLFLATHIIRLANILWTYPGARSDKHLYLSMICHYTLHTLFADQVEETTQSESQTSVNNAHTSLLRKGALCLSHAYLGLFNIMLLYGLSNRDSQGNFSYSAFFMNAPIYLGLPYNLVRAALQYQAIKALKKPQEHGISAPLKTSFKSLAILSSIATILGTFQDNSLSFWAKTRSALIDLYNIFTGTNFTTEAVETAERHIAQQRRMNKSTEISV